MRLNYFSLQPLAFSLFLSVLSVFFVVDAFAAQQAWIQHYNNGPGTTNQAVAMAVDKDGNIYVAGNSTRTNAPYDFDYVLVKYSPLGVQQWVNRFGSPGNDDRLRASAANTNGEVFITGTGGTVKYLSDGSLVWHRSDAGRGIAADPSGSCYLTGFQDNDFSTVKIDAYGSNVWLRTWDYRGQDDVSRAITLDAAGNVLVGGLATSLCYRGGCAHELWMVKYDAAGTLLWNVSYDQGADYSLISEVKGFACDAQGDLYVAAMLTGIFHDPWANRKLKPTGQFVWARGLNNSTASRGVMAMALGKGAVYYTGSINGGRYQTYKLTPDGTNIWEAQNSPGSGSFHQANAIAADVEGYAFITGASSGLSTGNDYATIKYGPDGQELWVQRYTETGNSDDQAVAIALGQNGEVYVTGFSNPTNGLYEITTIKYVQIASIEKKSNGNILLSFCGAPGSNYVIQATTNFPNWSVIGNATADSNGLYRFEDTNAPLYPNRFYKVQNP